MEVTVSARYPFQSVLLMIWCSTSGGNGTGMGAGQDKTLGVTVTVNQANAADVTPGIYTDTIAITLNP